MSMGGMECPECGMRLENEDAMQRHKEEKHGGKEMEQMEKPTEQKGAT